jgi:hypothetical protein
VAASVACAHSGADTRFHTGACASPRAFACRVSSGDGAVTTATAAWAKGAKTCTRQFPGSTFAVPVNGWQNRLLRAAAGSADVWIATS